MDIKTEIKEVPFLEVISQMERKSFSQDFRVKLNSDASVCNKVCETEIKEEGFDSGFSPQNSFPKNLVTNLKQSNEDYEMETITKMNEASVDSDFCLQNKRQFFSEVPADNPCNKDSELDTKIEIKEEPWWLETTSTEVSCVGDVTKDWVDESFPLTESIRCYRQGAPRDKSGFFSEENCKDNTRFNKTKHGFECEKARKNMIKETDIPETSSVQNRVYAEKYDGGKMVRKSSCRQYNKVIQQNGMQVHDFNKNTDYEPDLVRHNKCDTCGKCFTRLTDLERHKLSHEGIKPYKCDTCGKCFTLLTNVKRHKLTHEGIKPHKCYTCGKCFTRLTHLQSHKLIHEGIKPHKCDTCGKCFTRLTDLKKHKLAHEGIKPYKCDICGVCFTHLQSLKSHKFTHEGIKPHKCDTCAKCFTWLTDLKRHKLTHDGIKPHKCDNCGKCFTQLQHLKSHRWIHQAKKPHKCDICGRCFAGLQYLKGHKLAHIGIKPYRCGTCGKCFSRLNNLKSHKLSHEAIRAAQV